MNIYEQKRRWKWSLFFTAVLIVTASLWYTNILVQKIATDERIKLRMWADAIQRKARFVSYTETFFLKLKNEEEKRVHQLAMATEKLASANGNSDITFYSKIIEDNTTVPVILTDSKGNINGARNVDFSMDSVKIFNAALQSKFSKYPPILINSFGTKFYFHYTDSKLFTELRHVLDDLIRTFFSEVVENSASVPVIITDSTRSHIIGFGNLDSLQMRDSVFVKKTIASMENENTPIELNLEDLGKTIIFYKSSFLLTQLRYYPVFQLGIIALFLFISYMLFSTARRSEQNQVWVGMAKETAHQLGTPISSIMAWVELMRMQDLDQETVKELDKDVKRLGTIAERFSKIGSAPSLKDDNITRIIYDTVEYLKPRTSKKVTFKIHPGPNIDIIAPINSGLFEWVIENLCKNSIDAMSGSGDITIDMVEEDNQVYIDITDTGKGIPRSKFGTVFQPGYTSKKRGWGLGLTLAKRIIKEYHNGKIFVKNSVLNEGTTIRILLKKK